MHACSEIRDDLGNKYYSIDGQMTSNKLSTHLLQWGLDSADQDKIINYLQN